GGGIAERTWETGGEAGPEAETRRGGGEQTGARESKRRQQRNVRGEPARIRTGLEARPRRREPAVDEAPRDRHVHRHVGARSNGQSDHRNRECSDRERPEREAHLALTAPRPDRGAE